MTLAGRRALTVAALLATALGAATAAPPAPAQAAGPAEPSAYVGGTGLGDGGPAAQAVIPYGTYAGQMTLDPQGRRVFTNGNEVRRIEVDGTITRVAGGPDASVYGGGFAGDGGAATSALLNMPQGVQVASDGTVYVADTNNDRIRAVAPDGTITTVAGSGGTTWSAQDTPALSGGVIPRHLFLAPSGDLYFTEFDNGYADVRRLTAGGLVQLVAGSPTQRVGSMNNTCPSLGGLATSSCLDTPRAVLVDSVGNVLIADQCAVDEVDASTGNLNRFAGNTDCYDPASGDGGPATSATIGVVFSLAFDADGSLLMNTSSGLRKVAADGTISTERPLDATAKGDMVRIGTTLSVLSDRVVDVAQDGSLTLIAGQSADATGDGLPVADASFGPISGEAPSLNGGTVVSETRGRVWLIDSSGIAHRLAGTLVNQTTFSGEGGPARDAVLPNVTALAVAPDGTVYIGCSDGTVRKISNGVITTVAGTGTVGNGPDTASAATTVAMEQPQSLAVAPDGTVDILESSQGKVRALTPDGMLSTVIGGGTVMGRAALGQPQSVLRIPSAQGLSFAPDGSLLLSDPAGYPTSSAYRISNGTVTQAFAINVWTYSLQQDSQGRLLQAMNGALLRVYPDGSSEVLSTMAGVDPSRLNIGGFGGDGRYWWSKDETYTRPIGRIMALTLPGQQTRPPQVTGLTSTPSPNLTVSWSKPTNPDLVALAVFHPGTLPALTPDDGDPLNPPDYGTGTLTASVFPTQNEAPVAPGTPMTVSVFVRSISTGVTSAPVSVTVVPRQTATCSLARSAATLVYGQKETLVGTLKDYLGHALINEPVALVATPYGLKATTIASGRTTSTGAFSVATVPSRKTTYTFVHAADSYIACSASVVITVRPVVTGRLAATIIRHGTRTTYTAAVSPSHAGQYVYLQRYYSSAWHNVTYLKLNTYSKAAFSVGSSVVTKLVYRVYKPADADHLAAYSATSTLTVT